MIASGGDGGGWARAILASLAVVGLGSGLGLFVRKMLEAKQQEGRWDWGGSERAAAAAAKKRMDEEERERDRRQMQQLIDKLDAVQGTVNQVRRSKSNFCPLRDQQPLIPRGSHRLLLTFGMRASCPDLWTYAPLLLTS